MKVLFVAIILSLLLAAPNLAQVQNEPIKWDEFGPQNPEMLTQRAEGFRTGLRENPKAKGYVIIYRDKNLPFGFPIRLGVEIQHYLIENLGVPAERFEILNGGLRDKRITEMWLVPEGAKPPLTTSVDEKVTLNETTLFDSFLYPTPEDGLSCCMVVGYTEEAKKASFDKFAQWIKEHPTAKIYLIFYGQYCNNCSYSIRYTRSGKPNGYAPDIYLDSKETIAETLKQEKTYLIKKHKIDKTKIITVNGGYRRWEEIELWLVPPNGKPPKLSPSAFPPKRFKKKKPKK